MKVIFDEKPGEIYDIFNSLWFMNNFEYAIKRKESFGVYEQNEYERALISIFNDNKIDKKKLSRYFYKELEPKNLLIFENIWKVNDIDEYLDYIKKMDESQFRQVIVNSVGLITDPSGDAIDSNLVQNITKDNNSTLDFIEDKDISDGLKWEVFLLLKNKDKYIQEYIQFINEFLKIYEKIGNKRKRIIDDFNENFQKNIRSNGLEFVSNEINNIYDFSKCEEVYITTSALSSLHINDKKVKTCFVIIGPFIKNVIDSMSGINDVENNLTFIKNICEGTRFKIIKLLLKRDHFGLEIAEALGVSKPTVSHHMDYLVAAKVVSINRDGQKNYYSLNKDELRKNIKFLVNELEL